MGVYYLDTSALVKRYVTEVGTGWVRTITDPVSGNDIYVVKIAGPEAVSAFVRQAPPLPTWRRSWRVNLSYPPGATFDSNP